METTTNTTNTIQRLTTIALVLLIILLVLLLVLFVIGIIAGFTMMDGGMLSGNLTSGMSAACLDMMRNIQAP